MGLIMDNCLRGHGMRCLTLSMNLKTSPMDKRTEADEIILNKLQNGYKIL